MPVGTVAQTAIDYVEEEAVLARAALGKDAIAVRLYGGPPSCVGSDIATDDETHRRFDSAAYGRCSAWP
jgi:hypothetical protein